MSDYDLRKDMIDVYKSGICKILLGQLVVSHDEMDG